MSSANAFIKQIEDYFTKKNQSIFSLTCDSLYAGNDHISLKNVSKIQILEIGKIAPNLSNALSCLLKENYLVTQLAIGKSSEIIRPDYMASDHPYAGKNSLDAGKRIRDFLKQESDLLITIISGGSSSLVEILPEGIDKDLWMSSQKDLINSDLNIIEINKLRKSLSLLKNGGILNLSKAKRIESLIISDIPYGPIQSVGSGPSFFDGNCYQSDHKCIIDSKTYKSSIEKAHDNKINILKSMEVNHHVILDSKIISEDFQNLFDFRFLNLRPQSFNLKQFTDEFVNFIKQNPNQDFYINGEVNFKVNTRNGLGGRCSHALLNLAKEVFYNEQNKDLILIFLATDGQDGTSNYAGGFLDFQLSQKTDLAEINDCLQRFESYQLLSKLEATISFPKGITNISDLYMCIYKDQICPKN